MNTTDGNIARKIEVRPWRPWFAWRPVTTISKQRIWFQPIYRRCVNTYVDYDNWSRYEYADLIDVIAE
jgi:hypothetical protein